MKEHIFKRTAFGYFLERYRFQLLLIFILGLYGCSASTIVLRSTPEGAAVNSEIGFIGTTNVEISIDELDCDNKDCERTFVFTKHGFKETRINKIIRANHLKGKIIFIHATLDSLTTEVSVKTLPKATSIVFTIGGKEMIFTGDSHTYLIDEQTLWKNNHSLIGHLTITAPGYKTISEDVLLTKYKHNKFSYVMQEHTIKVSFLSEPSGVDVYDRYIGYLGRTPFTLEIPVDQLIRISTKTARQNELHGSFQLQTIYKKEGYTTMERTDWIRSDEITNTFNIRLYKAP